MAAANSFTLTKLYELYLNSPAQLRTFLDDDPLLRETVENSFRSQSTLLATDIPRAQQVEIQRLIASTKSDTGEVVQRNGYDAENIMRQLELVFRQINTYAVKAGISINNRTEFLTPGNQQIERDEQPPVAGGVSYRRIYNTILTNMDQIIIEFPAMDPSDLTEKELGRYALLGVDFEEQIEVPDSAIFTRNTSALEDRAGYPVYTGSDMTIFALNENVFTPLPFIHTLSYSVHTTMTPVKGLGSSNPRGYAVGDRVYAGTMIAMLSKNDPLIALHPEIISEEPGSDSFRGLSDLWKPILATDQLPVFDLVMTFQNEYGSQSAFTIFGVKIPDTGQVISMNDAFIEVSYTYMALDVDLIREIKTEEVDGEVKGIDILYNNQYLASRNRVYQGYSIHTNPFEAYSLWLRLENIYSELDYQRKRIEGLSLLDYAESRGIA